MITLIRTTIVSLTLCCAMVFGQTAYGQRPTDPPPFSLRDEGLTSIWTQSRPANEEDTSVRVIQGYLNWKNLEPDQPGTYDWSDLDRLLERAAALEKPTVLQINSINPDWMANEVPFLNFYSRGTKVYQFWHPTYVRYYKDLLEAFASYLEDHPNRAWALGIRLQNNAFNTEAWSWNYNREEAWNAAREAYDTLALPRPEEPDNPVNWAVPEGVPVYYPLLTREDDSVGIDYIKQIIVAHQESFHSRGIRTFGRLELEEALELDTWLADNYWNDSLAGIMITNAGVWHGGAEILTNAKTTTERYGIPLYSEDVKSTEERPPHITNAPSREQEIYWRQVLKLYGNVTYGATYQEDLDLIGTPAWDEGFAMVNRYAGMWNRPSEATGAFIVFAYWEGVFNDSSLNINNVGYFLQQSDLSVTTPQEGVGPNTAHQGYRAASLTGSSLALGLDSAFADQVWGKRVQVRVTYLDQPNGEWDLYVRNGNGNGLEKVTNRSTVSGAWNTDVFWIDQAGFPSTEVDDLVLRKVGGTDPIFHKLEVLVDESTTDQVSELTTTLVNQPNQPGLPLRVYPNPAHDRVQLINLPPLDEIVIRNTFGQVVLRQAIKGRRSLSIDVSGLESSLYLLQGSGVLDTPIVRFIKY